MSLWDDFNEVKTLEALRAPAPRREDFARNNFATFTDEGYLARVARQVCRGCNGVAESLVGVFHVERSPTGARRLQALGRGAQWPLQDGWPLEIETQEIAFCPTCLRELGFSRETEQPPNRTLVFPE